MKLSRVVEWYNYVHDKTEKSEHDLVENEIQGLDYTLESLITKTDWNDFSMNLWKFIILLVFTIINLYRSRFY